MDKNIFTKDEIIKILEHLVGEIEPVAESHIDKKRYHNLELWCSIADYMLARIYEVSTNDDLKLYSSAKNIIMKARTELEYIKSNYFGSADEV